MRALILGKGHSMPVAKRVAGSGLVTMTTANDTRINDRGESMDYRVLSVVVVENVMSVCIPQSVETQLRKKGEDTHTKRMRLCKCVHISQ